MERHSEWVERHRAFHEALVAACPGRWLFRLRSIMFDQLDRDRFVTKRAPNGLGGRTSGEHREIMNATLARDAELAVALVQTHILDTSEPAIELLRDAPNRSARTAGATPRTQADAEVPT